MCNSSNTQIAFNEIKSYYHIQVKISVTEVFICASKITYTIFFFIFTKSLNFDVFFLNQELDGSFDGKFHEERLKSVYLK